MESHEARAEEGLEGQSECKMSIQDEIKGEALYEVIEAEDVDDFIKEYVLNDQAYTLNQ